MTLTHTQRKAAFVELYDEHLEAIVNYLARRAAHADAVDVAAETFTVAWRRFDDVPVGDELPWLYGVARRTLANHRRSAVRRDALHDKLRSEWLPISVVEESPVHSVLGSALDTLAEPDREVLLLAGVEELKPAEIAVALEIAPDAARARLSRARARLRAALEAQNVGEVR